MVVLSDSQLKRIAKHKYNASCTTILDPCMQVWWRWFVELLPLWLAPNTITIVGLLINMCTTLLLLYFSPYARSEVPFWSLYLNAFGLFVYQTLDAVDGKQARRTGSSSPLGELFDHGCDVLSMIVVCVGISIAMKLGEVPDWMVLLTIGTSFLFYLTHWLAYVTGVVTFGKIDITEAQFMGMSAFLVAGFFGQNIFSERAPLVDTEFRVMILVACSCVLVFLIVKGMYRILQGGVGKNGSSIADTSVLSPAVPMGITMCLCHYCYVLSDANLFARTPCLFSIAHGTVLAKISILLLVASMSRSPIPKLDIIMLCPLVQVINIRISFMSEYRLLWFCFIFAVFNVLQYCQAVISEICNHLNIRCFTIKAKDHSNEESSANEVKKTN